MVESGCFALRASAAEMPVSATFGHWT